MMDIWKLEINLQPKKDQFGQSRDNYRAYASHASQFDSDLFINAIMIIIIKPITRLHLFAVQFDCARRTRESQYNYLMKIDNKSLSNSRLRRVLARRYAPSNIS